MQLGVRAVYRGIPIRRGYTGVAKRLAALRTMGASWHGATILDIGCGNGAYTLDIAREAAVSWGIDIDLRWLKEFSACDEIPPTLGIGQAAAEHLPFADGSFDVVFCIETLEHVDDEQAALYEMRRVLRAGGALLLTVPNKWYLFETHGLRGIPHSHFLPLASWLPDSLHRRLANARIYTARSITQLLEQTGWRNVRVDWMLPPFDMVRPRELQILFRRMNTFFDRTPLRRFGVSLIVAATK
ncbi:class I SAM-dependent methyltransferase [Roseiflexus sp.]|uniref:class I SAM-dependent methyltransferase n=1 Tax=Roseiflexus sp. TaxID=2562120 RepID=UPI00398B0EF7